MFRSRLGFAAAALLFGQLRADCLNQVAQFNPQDRTFAANITYLVVPVPKAAVQQAIDEAFPLLVVKPKLLPLPAELNFPEGKHPVTVAMGLNNDVRQAALQIDGPYRQSSTLVPFVGTGSSSTYFNAPLITYLGGTDESFDSYLAGLLPVLVSTSIGGIPNAVGGFIPKSEAYQSDGYGPDAKPLYSSASKFALVPNELSGPGIYPEAVDFHFSPEARPRYTLKQLKQMINQPFILNTPYNEASIVTCERNTYFFDNATTQVQYRSGNVTFGTAGSGPSALPGALQKASDDGAGDYFDVHGLSACAQYVGFNTIGGQECEEAARSVYPEALN